MPSIGKKLLKYWAILYNWKTADRIVTLGFFFNNMPEGAENTPGLSFSRYPASFYHS